MQKKKTPWLLLAFTLPTKRASQRVKVWRKLQRYGAIPLGNSGYLLPDNPTNQERFAWLATSIRKHAGEASVVKVQSIDNLPAPQLIGRFLEARGRDYQELIKEIEKFCSLPVEKRVPGRLSRLRGRFQEIKEIDFFQSPLQMRGEELLARADESRPISSSADSATANPKEYAGKVWVTRHRPGVDRSASAWLIRRFIDRKARFRFATEERLPAGAVPFDMFHGGLGHRGEDCTFETLAKVFRIRDGKASVIGQIIHDADILDEKFGRKEGFGIDAVLKGWAREGIPDHRLLERGIQMIEGLYCAL